MSRDRLYPERNHWNVWVLLGKLSLGMVTLVGSEAMRWEIKAFRVEPVRIHTPQVGNWPKFLRERAWVWGLKSFPDCSPFILFQTLCILANIADGTTAKELIMTNDDILQKIKYYMVGLCPLLLLYISYMLEAVTVALLAQNKLCRDYKTKNRLLWNRFKEVSSILKKKK